MRTILLTYGDATTLRTSLERCRRYGTEVSIVGATRSSQRGLGRHRSSLVRVMSGIGRQGLIEAMEDLAGQAPVLLLHDDVLLAAEGAEALLAGAVDRRVVVPASNHPDADGYLPELPPDIVQPLRPAMAPEPAQRFRTACWAASAERVRELLNHRLTGASTQIHLPDGTVELHPDVVATHLDSCRDRLEPPSSPDDRPLLVASMIVRNEESYLEDCLASLDGLVDRIDLCDTGSTDRTIEIAYAAGAQVIERPWEDDFSIARNHALTLSRDAHWVLQIDADERARCDDPTAFRAFLATALADPGAFHVQLHDIASSGETTGILPLPRVFPGSGTRYYGRLHEVPHQTDGTPLTWSLMSGLRLDHLGYQDEVVATRGKRARNRALARTAYESSPTPANALQLARSLEDGKDLEERISLLSTLTDVFQTDSHGLNETAYQYYADMYARALVKAGRGGEAWTVIAEGRARYPQNTVISGTYAEIGVQTGHFEDVLAAGSSPTGQSPLTVVRPDVSAAQALEVAKAKLATGDEAGAADEVEALLRGGVPARFTRWVEAVSVLALGAPDRAVDVLREVAAADATGGCLRAVAETFAAQDAASFTLEVCEGATDSSREQRLAALAACVAANDTALIGRALALLPDLDQESLRTVAEHATSELAPMLRERLSLPAPPDGLTLPDAVRGATDGTDDVDSTAKLLASDPTGATMLEFAELVPAAAAAPAVTAAVALGARSTGQLRTALMVVTLGGTAEQAAALMEHARGVNPEVIEALMARARARGAGDVASAFARALLAEG